MVRIQPDPPRTGTPAGGAVAQLAEHRLCKPGVIGSNPISSTTRAHRQARISCLPMGPRGHQRSLTSRARKWVVCDCIAQHQSYRGVWHRYRIKRSKCMRWMPWRSQAKKDVRACEKPGGAGNEALIPGCPNGETHPFTERFRRAQPVKTPLLRQAGRGRENAV